jgi:hypothetical protein
MGLYVMKASVQMLAVLVVAFGGLGCSATPGKPLPDIEALQFRLTLEADWRRAGAGNSVRITHRLRNDSPIAVCVGGIQQLLADEHVVNSKILVDALCATPLIEIPSGGSGEWSIPWNGINCLKQAPPGMLERFPILRCGAKVQMRSRIIVYRLRDHVPQLGAIEILSVPASVATEWPKPLESTR